MFGLIAAVYVDLYRQSPQALEQLDAMWPEVKRKLFMRVRFARTTLHELRGRACLLAGRRRKDATLIKQAEAEARTLMREPTTVANGFGRLLLANVHKERGDDARAVEQLRFGIPLLEGHGLDLWVPAAQLELGKMLGGHEGKDLVEQARRFFAQRQVQNLEQFSAMLMPSFSVR